jgi:hypothetical protein
VTVPNQRGRRRARIDAHGTGSLAAADVTAVRGIPCTTVARTLLDLGELLDQRSVERALERAEQLWLIDLRALEETLRRANGHHGAGKLRRLLRRAVRPSTVTKNDLEELFFRASRKAGLPDPEVNAWIPFEDGGGAEIDFLWREQRLAVETDGRETHGTRQAFESDRLRDQRLTLLGFRVLRFTWRQVEDDRERVAATVMALLAR